MAVQRESQAGGERTSTLEELRVAEKALRERTRRLEAVRHQTELQTWEGEGGGSVLREAVARRPDLQQARPSEVSSFL